MSRTQIRTDIDGSIATITLHTAEGINVMSADVLRDLQKEVKTVAGAHGVRATILTGEGKVFAAGADIKAMASFNADQAAAYGKLGQEVLNDIESLPSITVAALNGAALGGGMETALACDFRIAVKSAKIGLPETSLGLVPGWAGIPRMTKLIGAARAKKLYLSALPISAEDGVPLGLIDEVVNGAEDLMPRVTAFCQTFKRGAPQAIALAKRAWRTGDDIAAFAECFGTSDAKEGIAAFLEKRPASWME